MLFLRGVVSSHHICVLDHHTLYSETITTNSDVCSAAESNTWLVSGSLLAPLPLTSAFYQNLNCCCQWSAFLAICLYRLSVSVELQHHCPSSNFYVTVLSTHLHQSATAVLDVGIIQQMHHRLVLIPGFWKRNSILWQRMLWTNRVGRAWSSLLKFST